LERDAARIVRQVLSALKYIHASGVAHRDIKPENILSSGEGENEIVQLSGFGFSKSFVTDILNTQVGSPGYVAPEVIEGKEHDSSVDMWSLGVIVYILLCGDPPFYSELHTELINQILRCEYSMDMEEITVEGKDFVTHLLVRNPNHRYTAEQCLAHPWLQEKKMTTVSKPQLKGSFKKLRSYIQSSRAINKYKTGGSNIS